MVKLADTQDLGNDKTDDDSKNTIFHLVRISFQINVIDKFCSYHIVIFLTLPIMGLKIS